MTSPDIPIAVWLRDDTIGLRAPVLEDADHVAAWYEGAFPIAPDAAGELLRAQETIPWGSNPTIRLMVVDLATQDIVGGALVEHANRRVSEIRITVGGPAPSADRQRTGAAVLRLLVPWVMGELDMMTTRIDVPADETILIDAAMSLGMREAVRLREHIARPSGRIDLLMLELVNPRWGAYVPEVSDADA